MAFTFGAAKGPVFTRWTMEIKGPASQRSQSSLSHKHSQCPNECLENVYWHQKTCSLVGIPGLVMATTLWAASFDSGYNGKKPMGKDSLNQTDPLSVQTNVREATASKDWCNRRKDVHCYRASLRAFPIRLFFNTSGRCSVSEPQLYAQALRVLREWQDRITREGLPSSSEIPFIVWYRPSECPWLALLL